MSVTYYIRIKGRVSGPFDEAKVLQFVQRGQLSRSHEISEDGVTWTSAGDTPQLFEATKRRSPSPSGTKPTTELEPEEKAPSSSSEAKWFCAIDGQRCGPFSVNDIQARVSNGTITSATLVWRQGMSDWQAATIIPNLFASADSSLVSAGSNDQNENGNQISWSELLPVFRVFNDGAWSLAWVQCLAVALLFPIAALEYFGLHTIDLTWAAVTFSLYFSLLWTAFFHWCITPSPVSPWRIVGIWVFTATLGILGVLIGSAIVLPFFVDAMDQSSDASLLKRVVGWTFGVGLVEESGKLLAILLIASNMSAKLRPRTYAFLGVVSGLAFGTVEAIAYTYGYVELHEQTLEANVEGYGILFFLLILRWLSLPLLHAVWAGIVGFFVGLSYHARDNSWWWVMRGLFISALLHGLYNVGAAKSEYSWMTLVVAAASLTLFVGYLRSEAELTRQVETYPLARADTN